MIDDFKKLHRMHLRLSVFLLRMTTRAIWLRVELLLHQDMCILLQFLLIVLLRILEYLNHLLLGNSLLALCLEFLEVAPVDIVPLGEAVELVHEWVVAEQGLLDDEVELNQKVILPLELLQAACNLRLHSLYEVLLVGSALL